MNSARSSDPHPHAGYPVIAVDGYSSCGKSTFARMIARELGFVYIDSGAMYRAVALYCLENRLLTDNIPDRQKLTNALPDIHIRFRVNTTGNQETLLNGVNVEEKIRGIAVSSVVSLISQKPEVREKMVSLQRQMGRDGNVVMDGRDIGTVVFPDATLKLFMTADPDVRARRRYDELRGRNMDVDFETIKSNIIARDIADENRDISPLRRAEDAIVLDNTRMTVKEQMDWIRGIITSKLNEG